MTKAENKSEGMDALRLYLLAQPRGVSLQQAALARHFGIDRSTVGRWIASLEANGVPILWDEQKRVAIDRSRYFMHLRLTRHESTILMLALRLYQQRHDKSDRNVVEMLQKLGIALHQGIAPAAGAHVLAVADQQRRRTNEQRSDEQRILEALGDAWIDSRKVQLRYRPLRARRAFDDVFHPYLLEPSLFGRGVYLIGYSELAGALRVRKTERIERTPLLLDETFTVDPAFDVFKLLGGAWSIWFDADATPVTVRLRFSGDEAIRRMLEERWHPSEQKERDTEGRLRWSATVDEPQEMLPWIRSWAAQVEVLEPQDLRDQHIGELRRQLRMYGIVETPTENRDQRFGDIFG
jgi:predicted DNA-binding transcriptional regulator YafY